MNPDEVLFVIDAMIGQDAVNTAQAFLEGVQFTGVVLSKLDGDARGGFDGVGVRSTGDEAGPRVRGHGRECLDVVAICRGPRS